MLLALDTATRTLGLAVHDGHRLLAELTVPAPNNHTETLAPAVHDLLRRVDVDPTDLTALAVAAGPGSYTGVRIGVALAKGMAASRNLPLVGVNTLEIVAAAQARYDGALIVVVRAGRGRCIARSYRWSSSRWVPRGDARLLKWAELFESVDGRATIAGEVDEGALAAFDTASQSPDFSARLAPGAASLRRAGYLAELALEQLNGGTPADFPAAAVVPVYMNTID